MREIANFLWVGEALYAYEQMCLKSFIHHGFDVRVWSYGSLPLPSGATLMDASLILPREDQDRYVQGGNLNDFAAFSDVFRFNLLSTRPGEWWFDTDCVCLRDQSEFRALKGTKKVVLGWEDDTIINGAVLCFIDPELGQRVLQEQKRIVESKRTFLWGEIGPRLLTEYLTRRDLTREALPPHAFYAIPWPQSAMMNDPAHGSRLKRVIEPSYVCHLWNEKLSRYVDKRLEPQRNSFLDLLFRQYT